MINPKSASKMHGISAMFVPRKNYFLKSLSNKSKVKVEPALRAVFLIISVMMLSTENTLVLPLFSIMVMFFPFKGIFLLNMVIEIPLFILLQLPFQCYFCIATTEVLGQLPL